MSKIIAVLNNHGVFTDNYLTEVKGVNGTYGVNGRKILLGHNLNCWIRYDGTIWGNGFAQFKDHWELIRFHGTPCKRKSCKCEKVGKVIRK
jgi:hypothetical protein